MKKVIRALRYYYDYYIGAFLYAKDNPNYHIDIIKKYPERFPNEIRYLKEKGVL